MAMMNHRSENVRWKNQYWNARQSIKNIMRDFYTFYRLYSYTVNRKNYYYTSWNVYFLYTRYLKTLRQLRFNTRA